MSRFLFFILASAICLIHANAQFAHADPEQALVYFYGFEIERITGISEEEIEKLGCSYTALSRDLERTLTGIDASASEYERRDVRARIEMRGNIYFVDRLGFVRQGDNHFILEKVKFVASITSSGPCE